MKKLFILGFALIVLSGCAGMNLFGGESKLCENADSLICQRLGDPEKADLFLQITAYALVDSKTLKKDQVLAFFDKAEALIDNGVTFAELVAFVAKETEWINSHHGAAIIVLSQYAGLLSDPVMISEFDQNLIKIHLNRQRLLLSTIPG